MFFALLLALAAVQPAPGWRANAVLGSQDAAIEVRDVGAAEADPLLREALETMAADLHRVDSAVDFLNRAGGAGPHRIEADLLGLLARALEFCRWSRGAHGPLGGALHELWSHAVPGAEARRDAVASAACDRLFLDSDAGTVELAAGSRLDLRGFASGWVVDRAVGRLRGLGVANASVRLGAVERAWGPGPGDGGWLVELPRSGLIEPLEPRRLDDEALARAVREPLLEIAGDRYAPHLDLRTGLPAHGVVAVFAVAELALDAEALAITAFVLGSREGTLRAGELRPPPGILWLLGQGRGIPILTSHRWTGPREH